ncbi:MAG: TonB-dependent receptor [Williamsia sp.]|nr:TonB-dependent receptor [Williamsia sp.]
MQLVALRKLIVSKRAVQKLFMMKLTTFFLLVAFLNVNAHGYTQKVTLFAKEMSLVKVFKEIKRQTGYTFAYSRTLLQKAGPVTVQVADASVEQALNLVFQSLPLSYTIIDRTVVIGLKKEKLLEVEPVRAAPSPPAISVSGKISNNLGEALPGATVTEKAAPKNVVTAGDDGSFSITVANAGSVLVVSFVGYTTKEVKAGDGSLNIVLSSASQEMDVVVVGYGTQRNKDLTGSVSAVSSKDFNQGVVLSPQQAIQGKLAGVNISQNSGKPGGSNTIRIRGGTSLTGNNDPLYVIDGVPISTTAGVSQANIRANGTDVFDQEPVNPLLTLNPNDIESITVLKDASAAAIYGSRGANGVIVITTKKGSAGKGRVSLSVTGGMSKVSKTLDVLSADQYRSVVKDLGLSISDKGANTNWQDQIYRTGYSQDYYLSFAGGSDKTTYRASLGHGIQQGVVLGSKITRTDARINLNHSTLDDRLLFDMRVNYGQTFSNSAPISNTVGSEQGTSMNYEAYVFNPTYPVYDSAGNYNFVLPYRINPVSFSTDVPDQLTNNRFIGNLTTTLKITKPLSFNVNLGYTKQDIDRNSYIKQSNPLGSGLGGYASVQKLEDYSKLLETVLRFNDKFGRHSIDAIAGYSYQYFVEEGDRTTASGFLSDEFLWYSLQAASSINTVSTFKQSNTLISMYARANYNFDDRFLLTGTVRRDGSSRFGSGNRWGVFPSGSVAWRLSKEEFFKVPAVSDLKLRLSYGVTGNQEIGNLNSITTLGATTTGYIVGGQRITNVLPQQYANPNLRWEQTAQLNGGIDFAFLDGRIHGSVDYYNKKTTDLLLRLPVPSPTAINTQLANVGSVQNRGIEVVLGATPVSQKDFNWSINVVFSRNRNKVLSLSNDQFKGNNIRIAPLQGQGLTSGVYAQLITPGQPLGTFWGRRFTGIKNGVEQFIAGDTVIGYAQPKFTYGVSNTFNYKNWNLGINLRASVGNDVYNLTGNNLGYESNLPGRNVFVTAVTSGVKRDQPKQYSSRWIEDGSFLRLDNMTLGYDIHAKTPLFQNARVFLTGQNLFVITKYSGLDPEVNSEISGVGTAPLGVDYLAYPRARSISAGINLNF